MSEFRLADSVNRVAALEAKVAALTAERDALLAACKAVEGTAGVPDQTGQVTISEDSLARCIAAIAMTEGKE